MRSSGPTLPVRLDDLKLEWRPDSEPKLHGEPSSSGVSVAKSSHLCLSDLSIPVMEVSTRNTSSCLLGSCSCSKPPGNRASELPRRWISALLSTHHQLPQRRPQKAPWEANSITFPRRRNDRRRCKTLPIDAAAATTTTGTDSARTRTSVEGVEEADIVVVGSGIGGLCCGGLLARNGQEVLVLESHTIAGGAAHSFEIKGFHFDSGPSLFSGLSSRGIQANPLAQVLDALGESVQCVKYDSWMVHIPEGTFLSRIGPTDFYKDLETFGGPGAAEEWRMLQEAVKPLSGAAMALPAAALRSDWGVIITAFARYAPSLFKSFLQAGPSGGANKLIGPFSDIVDTVGVRNEFVRNWVDLLAFLLSGLKADATLAAEVVYMFGEWYKPGCMLEYPVGGTASIVDALVRGLEKLGGRLSLGSHVDEIVVEAGRAVGVRLRGGRFIKARKAVVTNASMWNNPALLSKDILPEELRRRAEETPQCDSFMHLHLGIDAKDLPSDLEVHHIVVNDWDVGVDAPQNVVLISIPSVLDRKLAPPGKHALHAYTPGTEPYYLWKGLDRNSEAYKQLKKDRSEVLWKAVERALGPGFDRDKCEVKLVGTPLTHERFLRRAKGTYGPAIRAGQSTFPGHTTPISSLYCCGDSTFPGIGIPAVAASGLVAANSLISVWDHIKFLDAIGL